MSGLDVIVICISDSSVWFVSSNLKHTNLSPTVALKYCFEGSMPSCEVFFVEVFGIFGSNTMPKDHYVEVKAGALV